MSFKHPNSSSASRTGLDGLSRYDILLVALPVAFLLAAVMGMLSSVHIHTTLAGASLFGGVLLVDAMFINPPVRQ